ncbi:MAG: 4Fe-4S binding protein [Clostridia bacterium]
MDKREIIKLAADFVENSVDNYINKEIAISENLIGMKIFDSPLVGFALATDEYFGLFKDPTVIGAHFILPLEWLPSAKSVISYFLPYSEIVKKANREKEFWPAEAWLHGRAEGQALINKLGNYLNSELINAGYMSLVPSLDTRYKSQIGFDSQIQAEAMYTSNWSERHAAFVCGLGTFGLSKGLLTQKGVAGRFGSIITELVMEPDKRTYTSIYEYCLMCGACVKNCPVGAISFEQGKNHQICSDFLDTTAEKFPPRYGCGKCQVGVPCESSIPTRCVEKANGS